MHWLRTLGFAILAIQLGGHGLIAQSDPCARRTVPVSVSSSEGNPLTGLTTDKFQATFRHHPITVLSVTPNDTPVRVFMALDASGSMTHEGKIWQAYIAVAEAVLDQLPASTRVGLMVFSDHVELSVPLTMNRTVIRAQFEQLRSRHRVASTALWDTLRASALQFEPPLPGDSIYAITDSDDDASRIGLNAAEEILVGRGVRLFTFSIEPERPGPRPKRWDKSLTHGIVEATGGYSVLIPEGRVASLSRTGKDATNPANDLTPLSQQLQLISTFARVELEMPEALHKLEEWDLRAIGMTGRDLVVEFPHKLASCPVQ